MINAGVLEKRDSYNKINNNINLTIGSFVNTNLVVGITNESAVADFIKDGFEPVQDSLVVSDFQFFLRYYLDDKSFFILKMPTSSNVKGITIKDRLRVGVGCVIYSDNSFTCDLGYDLLFSSNFNGWRKGEFNIGLTVKTASLYIFPIISTSIFDKFMNWLSTPLVYGYKQSMYSHRLLHAF